MEAAPQGFPLLRLPYVALLQVLVQVDPDELYKLATTSQKMIKALQASRWKLKYSLILAIDEGYFFSVRSVDDKKSWKFTITKPTENNLENLNASYNIGHRENIPHIFSHGNISVLWESCELGAQEVFKLLNSFLNFQKTEYFVFKNAVPLFLNQIVQSIRHILNIPFNMRDQLESVKNGIQYVVSNQHPEYKFQLSVNDVNVSNWLILTGNSFNWRHHLVYMNFRILRVHECTLSNRNMNRFLHEVIDGYYGRLQIASFWSYLEWNLEDVLRNIVTVEEVGPRTFIVEGHRAVFNGASQSFLINHVAQSRGTVITYQTAQIYKLIIVVERHDVQLPDCKTVPFDFVA